MTDACGAELVILDLQDKHTEIMNKKAICLLVFKNKNSY
jgi:hypothetical protein